MYGRLLEFSNDSDHIKHPNLRAINNFSHA
jgi:hypothetical protein